MTYHVGDVVQLTVTVSPDETPTLTATAPDGTTSSPVVTSSGGGAYTALVEADQAGVWSYAWQSPNGVEHGAFLVHPEPGQQPPDVSVLCAPWCAPADLPSRVVDRVGDVDDLLRSCAVASEWLYAMTGRRWLGPGCQAVETLRPAHTCGHGPAHYYLDAHAPPTTGQLSRNRLCSCRDASALTLPHRHVTSVESVTDDGQAVDAAGYELRGSRRLLRRDGVWWGPVEVAYTHGIAPPGAGRQAAVKLASELALSHAGHPSALPERVRELTRQGVTMALLDPLDHLKGMRTGIPEVDTFIAAVNPGRNTRRSTVWSPDTATRRHQ